jgi:hypothetical protein
VVAAAGSAGAGLVHAAAAGSHGDSGTLVWLFSLCAAAQLGWAAAVVARPTRAVLLAGVGINGAAVVTWFFTRTTGIPFVAALEEAEAVSTPDLVAALLGAMAVAGAVITLVMPISRRTMPGAWSAMVVIGTFALVVPAMAAGHSHGGEGHTHLASEEVHAGGEPHDHGDGGSGDDHGHDDDSAASSDHHDGDDASHDDDHDDADHDDGDHAHPASTRNPGSRNTNHHDDNDGHHGPPSGNNNSGGHNDDDGHHGPPSSPNSPPHSHPPTPNQPPHNHPPTPNQPPHNHPPTPTPTGPIVSLDDPRLTAAQRNAGSQLLVRTLGGMAPFTSVDAVVAAGYRSIGDASTGFEHFVNWTYFNDGIELDPGRIESIVIKVGPNGAKTVASGMYILNLGKSLANVPEIAGPLTTWHDHTNLCWVPNGEGGMRLSGVTDANGNCARGQNIVTPPMLHVWLTPQPCGPFSGIEGTHGEACAHSH